MRGEAPGSPLSVKSRRSRPASGRGRAGPAIEPRSASAAYDVLMVGMLLVGLGERSGVTRQTIAAAETGKRSPSLETAFRIAEVFDNPFEAVFHWPR